MTSQEKWNKICEYYEKYYAESEEVIQKLWEKMFSEIFGYSSLDGEIESHRKIQLGSTERLIPDIIIKNDQEDLFMVELKREDLSIDSSRKKQLYSYLKQEHNDLGILICNQMCIIDYNYDIPDEGQKCCFINFETNNPLGIKFIETFEKDNFSKTKAKAFIADCINANSKRENIKQCLTPLFLKELIINHFSQEYTREEIESVLSQYKIEISSNKNSTSLSMSMQRKNVNLILPKNNYGSNSVQKTEEEKLKRDINSVGKETFVKYFEYYNNPQYETGDIRKLFEKYENFRQNSMASKASTGKGIIKRGYAKQALEIIANSNIDYSLREKAREYLANLD